MLNDPLFYVVAAACLAVVVILMMGIGGFAKEGGNGKRANKIMRMRIIAQFVAIVLIVGYVWLRRS